MNYKSFLEYNINLAPVGVEHAEDAPLYFCTPKGVRVIGWAGVDGIHYCFIRGFSDMVFAVSPMNEPGNYVHPIASCFTDFLRLILACGNVAALEQAWEWDESQFDAFLAENPPDDVQSATLNTLRETLRITPMERPFSYLKVLHEAFDYSRIPYKKDYYDFYEESNSEPELPPWKVWFESGFWDRTGQGRPGIEMPIQRWFDWNGQPVYVPSVYSCARGLVVDICIEVSAGEIHAFMEKWSLSLENDGSDFTDEKCMLAEAENPLHIPFSPEVMMNGRMLRSCCGSGLSWNPCVAEGNDPQAKGILAHYALDPACGWVIWRCSLLWERSRRPQVQTLSLTLRANTVAFPGTKFRVSSAGERVAFIHPKTGQQHYLTVQEYERQQVLSEDFGDESFEYPNHYIVMSYTIFPDLPKGTISLADRVQGDRPRKKRKNPDEPETFADGMAIGISIIGGADGPTAIFITGQEHSELHTACSSLHFSDEYDAEWQIVLHEKTRPDITAELV